MEKRGKIRSKEKGEENENITDKGETNLFIVCLQPPRDKLINLIHSPSHPLLLSWILEERRRISSM